MVFDQEYAQRFIVNASLPSKPELFGIDKGMGMPDLKTSSKQSLVVGSNVVSFMAGVEAELRQAITDSSLFAQLAAAKSVNADPDPLKFFDAYFTNLAVLGWVIEEKESMELHYEGDTLDVHQAIIGVITSFLIPVAGAVEAVLAVLNGLRSMTNHAPFITLFNQQSRHDNIGRFQFTCIYSRPNQGLTASAMAFSLRANNTLTQVLFFKLQKGQASLRQRTGVLSIDAYAMKTLQSQLKAKLGAYRSAYIANVELGTL